MNKENQIYDIADKLDICPLDEETHEYFIRCFKCGTLQSVIIGEDDELEAAEHFYDNGWRIYYEKNTECYEFCCPECLKKKNNE